MAVGGAGGGGAGGGNIRAGGAYFEFFAVDKLSGVMDKLKGKAAAFGSFMKSAAGIIAGAAATVGLSLTGLFVGGVNAHADVARMAARFNLPIRMMSKLKHVADEAGVSVEDVMNNPGKFKGAISAAPGMSESDAREALRLEREWARTTRELQTALMPIVPLCSELAGELTKLAAGISGLTKEARAKAAEFGVDPAMMKKAASILKFGVPWLAAADLLGDFAPGKAGANVKDLAELPRAIAQAPTQVKGAFQTFGAMGQFGFGDSNSEIKQQTDILRKLLDGNGGLPDKIGKAVGDKMVMK